MTTSLATQQGAPHGACNPLLAQRYDVTPESVRNESSWLAGKIMDVRAMTYGYGTVAKDDSIMAQFAVDPSGLQETLSGVPYSATLTLMQASRGALCVRRADCP